MPSVQFPHSGQGREGSWPPRTPDARRPDFGVERPPSEIDSKIQGYLNRMVTERGGYDFWSLGEDERQELAKWYLGNHENLEPGQSENLLEQIMLFNLVDEKAAVKVVEKLSEKEKKLIGRFILTVLDENSYVRVFHECWDAFGKLEQKKLYETVCDAEPDRIAFIAPFDHEYYSLTGTFAYMPEKDKAVKRKYEEILHAAIEDFETAEPLVGLVFEYHRSRPEADKKALQDFVTFVWKKAGDRLFPYLHQIIEDKLLPESEVKEIFSETQNIRSVYQKNAEQDELERLNHELLGIFGEDKRNELECKYSFEPDARPRQLFLRLEALSDAGRVRKIEYMLRDFANCRQYLDDPIGYLARLCVDDFPVLTQIHKLGLSREEVAALIARTKGETGGGTPFCLNYPSEIKALIDFDRQTEGEEGPSLEKIAVDHLMGRIPLANLGPYDLEFFMVHAEEALSWFSRANREKLIKEINRQAPQLWLRNIKAAVKYGVPADRVLKHCSDDGFHFLKNYNRIIDFVKRSGQASGSEFEFAKIRKRVRKVFESLPNYFLDDDCRQIVAETYSAEEIREFIASRLNPPLDTGFFYSLLKSKFIEGHRSRCKRLLFEEGDLAGAIADSENRFQDVAEFLNDSGDLLRYIGEHAGRLDFTAIFSAAYVETLIKKDFKAREYLFSLAEKRGRAAPFVALSEKINLVKSQSMAAKKRPSDKNKDQILSKEEEAALDAIMKEVLPIIERACREKKNEVFESEAWALGNFDAAPFVRRDIEDYARFNPKAIFNSESFLDSDQFNRLLRQNENAILYSGNNATSRLYYGYRADLRSSSPNLRAMVRQSPFYEVEHGGKLRADYYLTLIDAVRDKNFFGFYEARLEKIAQKEIKKNGQNTEPDSGFVGNAEFVSLITRISLLDSFFSTQFFYESLVGLPDDEREEMLDMMEFAAFNGLAAELDFKLNSQISEKNREASESLTLTDVTMPELREMLLDAITSNLRDMFETPDLAAEGFGDFDMETIQALAIYYRQTCREDKDMKKSFQRFIRHAASGNFENWRAWGADSEVREEEKRERLQEMKGQNLLPNNLSLQQYEAWLSEESFPLEEALEVSIKDVKRGLGDVFHQAVADHHIEESDLPKDYSIERSIYLALTAPLSKWTEREKELREFFDLVKKTRRETGEIMPKESEEAEYKELRRRSAEYREEKGSEIKEALARMYVARLRTLTLEELKSKSLTVEGRSVSFNKLFRTIEEVFSAGENPEFYQDIQRMQKVLADGRGRMFGEGTISKKQLSLTDAVNLKAHIFIGEKPVPSCQSYNSKGKYNTGLLSYAVDPNVRIIQMYDEDGEIVARSVLRMLEDPDGNPRLFMERVYTVNFHEKIYEAVLNLAKRKAEAMEVGLYSHEVENIDEYEHIVDAVVGEPLRSKGSRNAYVYTDAGGGRVRNGRFKINLTYQIS